MCVDAYGSKPTPSLNHKPDLLPGPLSPARPPLCAAPFVLRLNKSLRSKQTAVMHSRVSCALRT
ncbi:hypothetical protein RSAG8_05608, partial [Rhizoctonia solani AG-8 WAC10335]